MNIISTILVTITFLTGIMWCLNNFIYTKKECNYQAITNASSNDRIEKNAQKKTDLKLNWIETSSSIFPMLVIILIIRSFIYEPFRIPSGSMMPMLLIGDFILVEKFTYSIKDPIFQKTLIKTGYPKRGDVVVFKYPKDPHLYYIKRIIGIPGDKIVYDPTIKEINIQPNYNANINYNDTLSIKYSSIRLSDFTQTFSRNKSGKIDSNFSQFSKKKDKINGIRLMKRKEILGNVAHDILILPVIQDQLDMYYRQQNQPLATWIVPSNHYFMIGDNRDNSADSRYWGFVSEDNIIGKAKIIWMSQKGKWPINIRFNRIGKIY